MHSSLLSRRRVYCYVQLLAGGTSMSADCLNDLVSVDTDILKNRVALVSMDTNSMKSARDSLIEMRRMVIDAVVEGSEQVAVPTTWLQELNAAYILLF